jgi:hypothetical protein
MKKLIAGLALAVMAGAALGSSASAAPKQQKFDGSILFPARHPDGCYTGLSRNLYSVAGDASKGLVGYVFDVDKATWKKPFKLEATGGAGYVDLDLTYYLGEFATQEEFAANPAPAAPASVAFETKEAGGEKGAVPEYAVKGIICMHVDEANGSGVNATFTYTAGKGVK